MSRQEKRGGKIEREKSTARDVLGFPGVSVVKNPSANTGDLGSIPGSGRFPGEGNSNPAGKSHGQRSLVGYGPWGCKRLRPDLATKTPPPPGITLGGQWSWV